MKKYLFCFGTRPEAIKMAPVIDLAKKRGHDVKVCISGQHRDMIIPFMKFFQINEDFDLNIMKPNQTLSSMTASILIEMEGVLNSFKPDCIFVQGDTSSTFTCALSAFYKKIPVAHIEAGLRTGNMYSPFPEEANRRLVSPLSTFHFPPTEKSKKNLLNENVSSNVIVTGNTSIDALKMMIDKIGHGKIDDELKAKYSNVNFDKKVILITVHRRENHGEPLKNICCAIKQIARDKDLEIILPVHLNPNVKSVVEEILGSIDNVHLLKPLEYIDFTWLMNKSFMIITDSGGVQEEAPYFKKPILVLRESTERPEGVECGVSKLVGSDQEKIVIEVQKILSDESYYKSFFSNKNPYGDGDASKIILDYLDKHL